MFVNNTTCTISRWSWIDIPRGVDSGNTLRTHCNMSTTLRKSPIQSTSFVTLKHHCCDQCNPCITISFQSQISSLGIAASFDCLHVWKVQAILRIGWILKIWLKICNDVNGAQSPVCQWHWNIHLVMFISSWFYVPRMSNKTNSIHL